MNEFAGNDYKPAVFNPEVSLSFLRFIDDCSNQQESLLPPRLAFLACTAAQHQSLDWFESTPWYQHYVTQQSLQRLG
jgi:hypothetical protein